MLRSSCQQIRPLRVWSSAWPAPKTVTNNLFNRLSNTTPDALSISLNNLFKIGLNLSFGQEASAEAELLAKPGSRVASSESSEQAAIHHSDEQGMQILQCLEGAFQRVQGQAN